MANANAEAKRFGASVLTTHRLAHWVPLLQDVGAIDVQNFFLDFRLLHPRVPLKDLSERIYDEGLDHLEEIAARLEGVAGGHPGAFVAFPAARI